MKREETDSAFAIFRKSIVYYILLCVLSFFFAVGQALLFSRIVSCVLKFETKQLLWQSIHALSIFVIYYTVVYFLKSRLEDERDKEYQKYREKMIEDFWGQSIYNISRKQPGDIRELFGLDSKKISDYYCLAMPTVIANTVLSIVILILFERISLVMGILAFFLSLLQVIPHIMSSVFSYKYYDADREAQAKWSENIMTMYFGNTMIKMYQLHEFFFRKFKELNRKWDKLGRKASTMGRISEGVQTLVSNLLTVCTYLVLGYLVLCRKITMEKATYLLVLSPYLFQNINEIFSVFPKFAEYRKVKKNLDGWEHPKNHEEELQCIGISVKNLTITYGEKTVIANFSQEFFFSDKYVVTGKNGSGKTSLLESLIGVQKPDSGSVTYGEKQIEDISIEKLNPLLFYLPQEDSMFDMTAVELFNYFNSMGTEMFLVAKEFGLTEDNLYKTPIKDLSGGERKKTFLCVALSMKNKFLLMDEPTNFLDADSKRIFIKKLKERTCGFLIVTHDRTLLDYLREYVLIDMGRDRDEK